MAAVPPADPAPNRDRSVVSAIAGLVAATVAIGNLAPSAAPPVPPRPVTAPADDPGCAEWTNGCRVCRRLAEGPACSMPGIACTPGAHECLRRSGP